MSWAYPCHRADVTGRQVLTKEKPIGHAYGALQELQEKTVLDADIQVRGLAVSECRVQGNTLVLRGTISNSYPGGDSLEGRVEALEAAVETLTRNLTAATNRIDALENALRTISLFVNLDITNNALAASGTLSIGSYGTHISGRTVEVEGC